MKKRIAAVICIIAMIVCQARLFMPETVFAEPAGESLVVRVQYVGEREEKIREKARFTNSQLSAMGASTRRYSNVTDVGTILSVIANGPKLSTVIEEAGIDMNSIKYFTFRTADGSGEHQRYSRNFTVSQHLSANRYYYPNLQQNYDRDADDGTLTPLPGSLDGRQTVPSILALKSYSTKQPDRIPVESDMTVSGAYRFCLGQTPLRENVKTRAGHDGGDVSSMESAQFIFGIDITLYGSPVDGLSLNLDAEDLKVGSKKRISAVIEGDELFRDEWGFTVDDLTWESSNPDIVSVDQNGVITVKKEGAATITATAPNGMTASVTINATEDDGEPEGAAATKETKKMPEEKEEKKAPKAEEEKETKEAKEEQKPPEEKEEKKMPEKKTAGIVVKEVKIGSMLEESVSRDDLIRQQMAKDAQALDKAEESDPQVVFFSAYTAVITLGFGVLFRIRRFFKEV